jgi:two-component system, OmpR family, sensor histidine kinase CiaH
MTVSADARSTGPSNLGDARLLRRTRLRLVAWSGAITLVVLVVLGLAIYVTTAWSLASAATAQLTARATGLERMIGSAPPPPPAEVPTRLPVGIGFGGERSGSIAIVVTPDGSYAGPADLAVSGIPDLSGIAAARAGSTDVRTATAGGTPVRIVSIPVVRDGATYVLQVVGDRTAEVRTLEILLVVLLVGGLGALALALVGGSVYAERALIPIRESLRRQREFAADASHELRTPLAVVRGSIEHLERHPDEPIASVGSALTDMKAEVDHMTGLVEELLLLARADSGTVEVERVPVDLGDLAASALGGLSTLAAERTVHVELDALPTMVTGDPSRLRQLVTILADNAVRHSPPDGHVVVHVVPDAKRAIVTVEDEGPGIAPADLPHVFDRFWRAPGSPGEGAGLGLAIAAWIVESHGGSILAEDRASGGARFRVSLPLAV